MLALFFPFCVSCFVFQKRTNLVHQSYRCTGGLLVIISFVKLKEYMIERANDGNFMLTTEVLDGVSSRLT